MENQYSYSLHYTAYDALEIRHVYIHDADDQWQSDFVDMQQYKRGETNNFNYILTVIDCFSKYAWFFSFKV